MNKFEVYTEDLTTYANNLSYYDSEADKFGNLIGQSDVSNEAWGIIGVFCKDGYTDKLGLLRDLLGEMKEGLETLTEKITTAARVYDGMEEDTAMSFGEHQATIDGPN